jgi:aminopeptidase N
MPIKSQKDKASQLITVFETTPKMSSYLLAFVVGELQKKTVTTKDGVEINVWSTLAQTPDSLDFALDVARRSIEFYNDYFGIPYPLPKSDHVALPDFSAGAMENWGLITYREACLLVNPKTDSISTKQYVATVIAHELSHQWFGNLVTMKWWNNLWLNESFASQMEYFAVDHLFPDWNIWLQHATSDSISALRRDSLNGVQPVQTDVNHPDEINTLFDGAIVYAKGGRLLRMLQQYVGEDSFRTGLNHYFKKFAYSNTEGNDLWTEIAKASGKDILPMMNTWISQSGFPVVHVTRSGKKLNLRQEQFFIGEHCPSDKVWPIPLNSNSKALPKLMETKSITCTTNDNPRLNIGDSAHFITHYSPELLSNIIKDLENNRLSPIDRVQLLDESTLLARGDIISSAELIPLIKAYKNESNEAVWDTIAIALVELRKFVETDKAAERKLRQFSGAIAKQQYARLGWQSKPGETESDTKIRATILSLLIYSENKSAIITAKKLYYGSPVEDLDPELRSLLISCVVQHSEDDIIGGLMQYYQSTASSEIQQDICVGVTSTHQPEKIAELLDDIKNPSIIRPQDAFRWFAYLVRNRYARNQAWLWLQKNWDWITASFAGDMGYDDFPRYAANGLISRQHLEEYKTFFKDKASIPALARSIALGEAEIAGRVNLIERDQSAVVESLDSL